MAHLNTALNFVTIAVGITVLSTVVFILIFCATH